MNVHLRLQVVLGVLLLLRSLFGVGASQKGRRPKAVTNQQPKVTARDLACVFMKSPEEVDRSEVLSNNTAIGPGRRPTAIHTTFRFRRLCEA